MTEHVMKLDELIPQLKSCGYECEAGKLECNIAFRQIAHIIERLERMGVTGMPDMQG